ncbi:MAG TPA: pirin family protein [Polaromonas sp.]|uniref:pirin family protein n=1 Tax=Polaromonas sp. TaxID=1869339 RepID=UPI002D520DA9|nr:pirin family protein [Polaromonas sp.]HYW55684.1 pirin family protein [Polaromonas sp.]
MPASLQLTGHNHDLGGGFLVRRLLPAAQRQSVGPFVFFDHFGPVSVEPGSAHDVRPHPHIGLATVTYLFDGAIMHRDSLGVEQCIAPGAINWMTAGRGIVHSERTPEDLKEQTYVNHGIQLWAALPKEHEETDPAFEHTPATAIPSLMSGATAVRVLIGHAFGLTSPVKTFSTTVYLDVQLAAGVPFELPPLAQELALYAVDGDIVVDGVAIAAHTLVVLVPGSAAAVTAATAVRLMVIGGDALEARRFMWWNFVSSRKERIVQASLDWENQDMGQVSGDAEFIPLPERRFKAT